MTTVSSFINAPGGALLDPANRARSTKGVSVEFDRSIAPRDWIKPATVKRDGVESPNEEVYYFFSNPDLNSADHWAAVDEVNTAWSGWHGTPDRLPYRIARVPVAAPQITVNDDGTWNKAYASDPILKLLYPTGKFAADKTYVSPETSVITSYVNADGEVRVLGFSKKEFRLFMERINEWLDDDPDFSLAGRPVRVIKTGSGPTMGIRIKKLGDHPNFDMSSYTPEDLAIYLGDVRAEVESWLEDRKLWPVGGETVAIEDTALIPDTTGDPYDELLDLSDEQLRVKADEYGVSYTTRTPRHTLLGRVRDAMNAA